MSNCQNKSKLFAALESCVLLRTTYSEMVFQALIVACNDLYKNSLGLIETILSLSHPLSFRSDQRAWPPVLMDTGVLSQSGKLISILVDLKIKNQVRVVPQLEFFVDDTNDYVEKMDHLFDQISKEPRQDED